MAQYRDIDLPSGATLRINGELLLPSSSLSLTTGNVIVGGIATVYNSLTTGDNIIASGNIQAYGTGTINGLLTLGTQATATTHAVRADRLISSGSGLTGGGNLTSDRTLSVLFGGNGTATTVSRSDHTHSTLTTTNSDVGLGSATWTKNNGEANIIGYIKAGSATGNSRFMIFSDSAQTNVYIDGTVYVNEGANKVVDESRSISSGSGLTGGGNLSTNRTLAVDFSGNGSSNQVSRADHNHDASYLKSTGGTLTNNLTISGSTANNNFIYFVGSDGARIGYTTGNVNSPSFSSQSGNNLALRVLQGSSEQRFILGDSDGSSSSMLLLGENSSDSGTTWTRRFSISGKGDMYVTGNVTIGSQATSGIHAVRADRSISTSSGLTGGGDLTTNRTLSVDFSGNGSSSKVSRADHNHDSTYVNMGQTITFSTPTFTGNPVASTGIHFSSQSDWADIYYEQYASSSSRLIYLTADDGDSDYHLFRHKHYNDSTARDLLEIKYSNVNSLVPLKVSGNDVWHLGNMPNPFTSDGGTLLGTLSMSGSNQIQYNGSSYNAMFHDTTDGMIIRDTNNIHIIFDSDNNDPNNRIFTIRHDSTTVGGSGELFRVNGSGNVGIGDSNPAYKLSVNGDIKLTGEIQSTSTIGLLNGSSAQGINTGKLLASNAYSDESLVPTNGIYSKGIIMTSGGFGYNTSDMSKAPLWINGSINYTTAIFGEISPVVLIKDNSAIAFNAYYNGSYKTFTGGKYTGLLQMNNTSGDFIFQTGDIQASGGANTTLTERVRIGKNGTVGINTSGNSSYKLDVNGSINSSSTTYAGGSGFNITSTSGDRGVGTKGQSASMIGSFSGWDANMLYINTMSSGGEAQTFSNGVKIRGNTSVIGYINSSSGANITGNTTITGTLYLGPTNGAGEIIVRNGTGASAIQLDGDSSGKLSGVNSYIDGNGNTNFGGTVSANAIYVTSTGNVANLNATYLNNLPENRFVKNQSIVDISGYGLMSGGTITQLSPSPSNTTVTMSDLIVYTSSGMRVFISGYNIVTAVNSTTGNRVDTIFVYGPSKGTLEGTIGISQGGTPAIPTDAVIIAQITLRASSATILNSDINQSVRQWKPVSYSAYGDDKLFVKDIKLITVSADSSTNSVLFNNPIKGTSFAKSFTFSIGITSQTWNHNLNLDTYVISMSTSTPERHVYWSNKSGNSIVINLDDIDNDEVVYVDALITAY